MDSRRHAVKALLDLLQHALAISHSQLQQVLIAQNAAT